jgi:hypothetical protein
MKRIYIIIAILAFTASACKKSTIDLTPEDSYTTANFFKTEAQFRQAVAGAYVPLRDVMTNDFHSAEMRSDNTHYQPFPTNRGAAYVNRENIDDFENLPGNTYVLALWENCYKVISRANIVIERLAGFEMAEPAKNNIDGQAKFLRAWSYFKLVRQFGGVPLYLKELKKADDAFVNRSTEAEVFAQIIADASDAIKELSNPVFSGNKQSGEATKGAATVLLADVYVTLKRWKDAEDILVTLQPMGYALQTNYAEAFLPVNKNSRESLFEVQYLEGTATGTAPNAIPFMFLPRTLATTVITGTAFPSNNKSDGGWNTPTPDLISAYEPGDKRLDASIGIIEGAYNGSDEFVYAVKKDITTATPPAAGKINLPYVKKFIHPPYTAALNSNDNWPVYRYAEALLLLAEARNEQGKATALGPLNEVRTRAFGAGLGQVITTDPTALRAIILKERRTELAFENKRWHDLVRSGNAVQIMNTQGTAIKTAFPWHTASSYNVTANKLLFPIPSSEIEFNPALTQNPL